MKYKTTKEIPVPKKLVDQIIGQDEAVEIIKKAANQKRNVLLIGEPGSGKSMLAQAMAELLPTEKLEDVLIYPNASDPNNPKVKTVQAGEGKKIIEEERKKSFQKALDVSPGFGPFFFISLLFALSIGLAVYFKLFSDIILAAFIIIGGIFLAFLVFAGAFASGLKTLRFGGKEGETAPKLLIDNSGKTKAPFMDATGAHSGALLGDIRHDPYQCFSQCAAHVFDGEVKKIEMDEKINELINNSKNQYIKGPYHAAYLPLNSFSVIGLKENELAPVSVLSVNMQNYEGKLIELTTETNKKLLVTPEHKIAVLRHEKIKHVKAEDLNEGDKLICLSDQIIDENDILATFSEVEQERARSYFNYLKIKERHSGWGYKRLAKALCVPAGRARWWHSKKFKSKPRAVKTIEWLRERKLIPLSIQDKRLPLIAKMLGAFFGDGGVFANLNGVFLSSSEKKAVLEFRQDLETVFSKSVARNSLLRRGGEYGNSWNVVNANRAIVRFFIVLGAPLGRKTQAELNIPAWLKFNKSAEDMFFSALFGGEVGIPKLHKQKNRLNTLEIGFVGTKNLEKNRILFLKQISAYLESKGVSPTSIHVQKKGNNNYSFRLLISTKLDDVLTFQDKIKLQYCTYKTKKLRQALADFIQAKKSKYFELIEKGYGAETVMNLLNLTPRSLYIVLNEVPK